MTKKKAAKKGAKKKDKKCYIVPIRFPIGLPEKIGHLAEIQGLGPSAWVRMVALQQAGRESNLKLVLNEAPKIGTGEQISIRFRLSDMARISAAAEQDQSRPSPWIRAVVISKIEEGEEDERRAARSKSRSD